MNDADKRGRDAAEQTPPKIKAERNPWYLFATLYGLPGLRLLFHVKCWAIPRACIPSAACGPDVGRHGNLWDYAAGAARLGGNSLARLNERSREIFRLIVDTYLAHGDAVGSRHVARLLPAPLSPASVRNVMQDLEEIGLIYAPHTSAGRLPTELGLRFFVDALLELGADVSWRNANGSRRGG